MGISETNLKDHNIRIAVQGLSGPLRQRAIMKLLQHPELIERAARAQEKRLLAQGRRSRWPVEVRLIARTPELDAFASRRDT